MGPFQSATATPRDARRKALAAEVRRLFKAHRGTYGSPRITADLREAGWRVSENTVAAVMREQGLAARRKKRRRTTTRPGKGRWRAPDLVKRDFPAQQVNRKWYGDGTEIPTGEGKLYLASVLDVASRRVLGFAAGEHHDAALAYGALVMALAVRGGQVPGVIMHTDQGSEYTAGLVRQACARLGIRQSMGRPGSAAFDAVFQAAGVKVLRSAIRAPRMNSIMERWIGSCRRELLDRTLIWNQRHLMTILREYEDFYNTHRPHRTLSQAAPLRPLPNGVTDLDYFHVKRRDRAGGVIHEYRLVAQVFGTRRTKRRPVCAANPAG